MKNDRHTIGEMTYVRGGEKGWGRGGAAGGGGEIQVRVTFLLAVLKK